MSDYSVLVVLANHPGELLVEVRNAAGELLENPPVEVHVKVAATPSGPGRPACPHCDGPRVIGKHEFRLMTSEAPAAAGGGEAWRWVCSCSPRAVGRWNYQSDSVAYHAWERNHVGMQAIPRCERESVTPTEDGGFIIDCSVHGEIGTMPGGQGGTLDRVRSGEFEDVERIWSQHVAVVNA